MKKVTIYFLNLILVLSLVILASGCKKEENQKTSDFYIYYVNKEGTKLSSQPYTLTEKTTEKKIMELINKLEEDGSQNGQLSAIPDTVKVNGYDYNDGLVVIDFADGYTFIDKQREVLCRAATVITLCQLKEVEYVAFTVNDYPYRADGVNILGAMKASDFVVGSSDEVNEALETDFVIYFADKNGNKLIPYEIKAANYGDKTKEIFVVEQLIKGPKKDGYTATLSSKVEINSVVTANNICYVDFAENFLTEPSKVSNELLIYSIVNSLSELTGIHKVQISVNGESAIKFNENVSLNDPFIRNLDLINMNNNN